MTPIETRAAFSLASIFSLRMFGLFLILPVFALYAENLVGIKYRDSLPDSGYLFSMKNMKFFTAKKRKDHKDL